MCFKLLRNIRQIRMWIVAQAEQEHCSATLITWQLLDVTFSLTPNYSFYKDHCSAL